MSIGNEYLDREGDGDEESAFDDLVHDTNITYYLFFVYILFIIYLPDHFCGWQAGGCMKMIDLLLVFEYWGLKGDKELMRRSTLNGRKEGYFFGKWENN